MKKFFIIFFVIQSILVSINRKMVLEGYKPATINNAIYADAVEKIFLYLFDVSLIFIITLVITYIVALCLDYKFAFKKYLKNLINKYYIIFLAASVAMDIAFNDYYPSAITGFIAIASLIFFIYSTKKTGFTAKAPKEKVDNVNKASESKNKDILSAIYVFSEEIEDEVLVRNVKEIVELAIKINQTNTTNDTSHFIQEYCQHLYNVLVKYDNVENSRIESDEQRAMMQNVQEFVKELKTTFKSILKTHYSDKSETADAEVKALRASLKIKGYI